MVEASLSVLGNGKAVIPKSKSPRRKSCQCFADVVPEAAFKEEQGRLFPISVFFGYAGQGCMAQGMEASRGGGW